MLSTENLFKIKHFGGYKKIMLVNVALNTIFVSNYIYETNAKCRPRPESPFVYIKGTGPIPHDVIQT